MWYCKRTQLILIYSYVSNRLVRAAGDLEDYTHTRKDAMSLQRLYKAQYKALLFLIVFDSGQ